MGVGVVVEQFVIALDLFAISGTDWMDVAVVVVMWEGNGFGNIKIFELLPFVV